MGQARSAIERLMQGVKDERLCGAGRGAKAERPGRSQSQQGVHSQIRQGDYQKLLLSIPREFGTL